MTEHLTFAQLSALADGELAGDDLNAVKQHIDECLPCARSAVDEWLLKGARGDRQEKGTKRQLISSIA